MPHRSVCVPICIEIIPLPSITVDCNLEIEPDLQLTEDEKIDVVARRIMAQFKPVFLELAK